MSKDPLYPHVTPSQKRKPILIVHSAGGIYYYTQEQANGRWLLWSERGSKKEDIGNYSSRSLAEQIAYRYVSP
jgi:hypothetical protein